MRTAASARSSRGSDAALAAGAGASARALLAASALAAASVLALLSCKTVEPPPPPPAEPAREEVVSWQVAPPKGYHPDTGFVTLEYAPPEELGHEAEPPAGGRLTVHLGYLDIHDANTVWYRFEVMEGARVLLRLEGEENIPNVRDPDQYWWNDLDLDLETPIDREIRVVVTDKRIGASYPFTVRRAITYR